MRHISFLIGSVAGFLLPLVSVGAETSPFKIIVNAANPVGEMDRMEIADFYLNKSTHWPNGIEVLPVICTDPGAFQKEFLESVLGMDSSRFKTYWAKLIFAGRGLPPREMEDANGVVQFVKANPGAIAFVSDATNVEAVKVLEAR